MARELSQGQQSVVWIAHVDGSAPVEVWRSDELLVEAPNWHPTTDALLLNGDGRLWWLASSGGELEEFIAPGLPPVNNDHVLAPRAGAVVASCEDFHLYEVADSGRIRRITDDAPAGALHMHYLHGISSDEETLVYTGIRWDVRPTSLPAPHPDAFDLFTVPLVGGDDVRVTHGAAYTDGGEFSPDGNWIYFNTEHFSPGHAQIARIRPDGSGLEQLTFDERVNWFPHLSPDGRYAAYLSYPPGTQGHPADLDVEIRLVEDDDWDGAATLVSLFGGQGTMNVGGWAPDSRRFAFVSYPMHDPS